VSTEDENMPLMVKGATVLGEPHEPTAVHEFEYRQL